MLVNRLLTVCMLWKLYVRLLCLCMFLTWVGSKSGNVLFRSMPNGNCLFSSASLSLVREITHWCMYSDGSWQVICKCNICPTFALKSLYGKSQSVIGKKVIFLDYRTVFELTQGQIPQKVTWIVPGSLSTKWCKIFGAWTWPISKLDKNLPSCCIYNIRCDNPENFSWISCTD